jgi:DNA-binding NtrC family response regulator
MRNDRTIWVVEDDSDMRELVVDTLRRAGLFVEEFASGRELRERLSQLNNNGTRRPALIVLDHHMPDVHGLDVWNNNQSQIDDIPVIVITAFGDRDIHARARQLGAVAVFDKPFDLRVLKELVEETLSP